MKLFLQIVCLFSAFIANAAEQPGDQTNGATNQPPAGELQRLQGTWEGFDLGDNERQKITITITGGSLRFHRDTNFWFETTMTLPAAKDPKQFRATIKDCPPSQADSIGEVVVAIFKIEDGKLTIAPIGDDEGQGPKSFEAIEERGMTRYELRKVHPPKKDAPPPPAN